MTGNEEVVQRLTEIVDLLRQQAAVEQSRAEQYLAMQREAIELADRQYRDSARAASLVWWAIIFLIAVSLGGNALILTLAQRS